MREIIFDLIVFAVGMSLGVVLASFLFERKRKEVMDLVDVSLNTVGIKRTEFDNHTQRLDMLERIVSEQGRMLGRDQLSIPGPI